MGDRLIMVIDDDDSGRSALADLLQAEGFRVVGFPDGGDALAYLSDGQLPDLILLDLMLPMVDGWKFRAEQMMNPELAAIPVIVVTAAPAQSHESDLDAEVVRKPFDTRTLLSKIRRYCASAETTESGPEPSRRTA